MHFTRAIVRPPGPSLERGLSTANLGVPEIGLARNQHEAYCQALRHCGVEVIVLPPLNEFPDSTFVEDVAVLTPTSALVTLPGAPSRQGERQFIIAPLLEHFKDVEYLHKPATLEGGDVMQVGDHFFIGLSSRTNAEGARQLNRWAENRGMHSSILPLDDILHLKTGVSWLGNDTLLVCEAWQHEEWTNGYRKIIVPANESYAANCLRVNDVVLVPSGFPQTLERIAGAGFDIWELDMSEFQKVDGGLSCLSLRF